MCTKTKKSESFDKEIGEFLACWCGIVLSRCAALSGAVWHSPRVGVVFVVFLPCNMFIGTKDSAMFENQTVVRPNHDLSFHHHFEHGSGTFILTCGCCWFMVSMECASGETSGYLHCGEVTEMWPLWMRLQEMDPK